MLSFHDIHGDLLVEDYMPPSGAAKLSFLGVVFDDPQVARVSVGTALLDPEDEPVMDDFLHGEPVPVEIAPVPLPAGVVFGLTSIAGLAAFRRRAPGPPRA
ncbi:VPLPA-CTERM sorting domain-containing protein [Rhodovulum kholense]|uniref:Putative secreted protein n=1 Tax=Rhodovulum kholense TaxID=453584 RepID=A0A8E2VIT6_9RHOB|nr:VPLPA-CTERM sorting domain-containing protein [Rhodovulum kholense]PTW48324.1 putative secreted protein [Rhodovulum kholense]